MVQTTDGTADAVHLPKTRSKRQSGNSLIEFPNPARHAMPEWRKELGERVREVQERRAREASLEEELSPAPDGAEVSPTSRSLELLATPSLQPTNPLVIAALRRIERAHRQTQYSGNVGVATAAAYEEEPEFQLDIPEVEAAISVDTEQFQLNSEATEEVIEPEKTYHLSVVSAPLILPDVEVPTPDPVEASQTFEEEAAAVKPKRLIRDNDPALNYLDSIQTSIEVEIAEAKSAPVFYRVCCAVIDLVLIALFAAPVVALVKLTDLRWEDPRVIGFAAGTLVVAAFLYLTINTALTGRTFAMRLFSLRIVDARTGLIPTGTQSAGRAFFYMLSLATAGLGLLFLLIDRDRRTAHDRFTRTAVVRV